jgi:hypothetical protein
MRPGRDLAQASVRVRHGHEEELEGHLPVREESRTGNFVEHASLEVPSSGERGRQSINRRSTNRLAVSSLAVRPPNVAFWHECMNGRCVAREISTCRGVSRPSPAWWWPPECRWSSSSLAGFAHGRW